jgi:hypothetical protein
VLLSQTILKDLIKRSSDNTDPRYCLSSLIETADTQLRTSDLPPAGRLESANSAGDTSQSSIAREVQDGVVRLLPMNEEQWNDFPSLLSCARRLGAEDVGAFKIQQGREQGEEEEEEEEAAEGEEPEHESQEDVDTHNDAASGARKKRKGRRKAQRSNPDKTCTRAKRKSGGGMGNPAKKPKITPSLQSSREARLTQFIALSCARLVQGNARHNYGHIKVTHLCFAIDALGVARLDSHWYLGFWVRGTGA